jgi:mRNA interferase RelE/StbE
LPYTIKLTKAARKDFKSLDGSIKPTIVAAIKGLSVDPEPPDSGAMKGKANKGRRKLRVGDWRIVYRVKEAEIVVSVIRIGHRREVYDSIDDLREALEEELRDLFS